MKVLPEGLFFSYWDCGFEVQEQLDQATVWQLCQSLPAAGDLFWGRAMVPDGLLAVRVGS